jgi:hypothetical protein
MSDFDPWTATMDEALAMDDPNSLRGPFSQWSIAHSIIQKRVYFTANPLEAVARCVRHGLVAPDWLSDAFIRQFNLVLLAKVGTWDEAFGPAHPRGKHLSRLRLERSFGLRVLWLFSGDNRLPRTNAGYAEAARNLGISTKQVQTLLPRTRSNHRGHRPQKPVAAAPMIQANDPFSLLKGKKPKS